MPAMTITSASPRSVLRSVFRAGPSTRILHLTWLAFFTTFVVWFNFAPFATTIGAQFHLSKGQLVTLGLCNLALTVPARLVVGSLLDRFGPRRTFSAILLYALVPCLIFATAQDFTTLVVGRLLIGVVGAGFVVGIRMVSEWFDPAEVGTAEGVYGGWGNFGAAAATLALPVIAGAIGGPDAWRWVVAGTGVAAALYGVVYYRSVSDTPDGVAYQRTRRASALEVTSPGAVTGLMALSVPLAAALGVIGWRIWKVGVITSFGLGIAIAASAALLAVQLLAVHRTNAAARADAYPAEERYPFSSVVVLSVAYACTFGSELAAVSFLPTFFETTWGLSAAVAGAAASAFAVMNLVSRPAGGMISDLVASRTRWLTLLLACLAAGYLTLSRMTASWPLGLAIAAVLVTSLFAQAGNGAVYAIVPLVKKRVSGQIAGMAGAYGNVGGIVFLTALLILPVQGVFVVMGVAAAAAALGAAAVGARATAPAGAPVPAQLAPAGGA